MLIRINYNLAHNIFNLIVTRENRNPNSRIFPIVGFNLV